MKLNWFSPLPPLPTDVAHYTMRILPFLRQRAEVVLWTNQQEIDIAVTKNFEVRRFDAERLTWEQLNRATLTFYNIGNNPHFHDAIWQVSRHHPGIVVLHDTHLHHFFDNVFLRARDDKEGYLEQMGRLYGAEGHRAAQNYLDDQTSYISQMAEHYPLTELALEGALGALVHSEHTFERLHQHTRGVVAYAPLPYEARKSAQAHNADEAEHRHLIAFGYLGPNRQLDSLFRALAGMPEKSLFRLDIYGQVWDEVYLRNLIRRLDLDEIVKLHGFVPESELESALAKSDMAINLRFPTTGEASSSQLRIWAHALPSLVTDVDWYATLPADAVARVRPAHEVADIQLHLRLFLENPQRFRRMGERGRQMLTEQHTPESYVATLCELAKTITQLHARATGLALADRATAEVKRWGAAAPNELIDKFATEIHSLTTTTERSAR